MDNTFKKVLILIGVFIAFVYVWFAVLPEWVGFSFPTGGWDWNNFIAIIASMTIAAWGINETIKSTAKLSGRQTEVNSEISRIQTIMSVKPCLDVLFNEKKEPNVSCDIGVYIELKKSDDSQKYCGSYYSVQRKKPHNFILTLCIKIRNIGLSTALDIETSLNIPPKSVNSFNMIQDYIKKEYDIRFNEDVPEIFPISPPYNLVNNYNEGYYLFLNLSEISDHYVALQFKFKDVFNTQYVQYLYLYTGSKSKELEYLPFSNVLNLSEIENKGGL